MKSNIEHNIKNQLENREIPVSENAWDRLQQMMDEPEIPAKKNIFRKLWIPLSIAASVVLLVGVFWAMNAEAEPKSNEIQVVNTKKTVEVPQESIEINSQEIIQPKEIIKEEKPVLVSNSKPTSNQSKPEIRNEQIIVQPILEEEIPVGIEIEMKNEENSALVIQKETKEETPKKPNYVDPEMLLYSIENNNAVIQSQSDSRIVIKDFNK